MSFSERLAKGRAHEERVLAALRDQRWMGELFGQGQIPAHMRDLLRRFKTAVRYMPDIIAGIEKPDLRLAFVDAKWGDRWQETGNHDIESAALRAAVCFQQYADAEVWIVFPDMSVISPTDALAIAIPGRFCGNGSGTPFELIPTKACRPFDDVFSSPVRSVPPLPKAHDLFMTQAIFRQGTLWPSRDIPDAP